MFACRQKLLHHGVCMVNILTEIWLGAGLALDFAGTEQEKTDLIFIHCGRGVCASGGMRKRLFAWRRQTGNWSCMEFKLTEEFIC